MTFSTAAMRFDTLHDVIDDRNTKCKPSQYRTFCPAVFSAKKLAECVLDQTLRRFRVSINQNLIYITSSNFPEYKCHWGGDHIGESAFPRLQERDAN